MHEMELLLHSSSTREVHPSIPSGSASRELWDTSRTVSLHDRVSLKALLPFDTCKPLVCACMAACAHEHSRVTCETFFTEVSAHTSGGASC